MQMLTAEIGFERGGSGGEGEEGGEEAADAAANVAQGQATKATSMGAAIKDFLTTPQVMSPTTPSTSAVVTLTISPAIVSYGAPELPHIRTRVCWSWCAFAAMVAVSKWLSQMLM